MKNSALTKVDPKAGERAAKEIRSAEKLGCDCNPTADVQENGVVLAHGPDCTGFGRKAFEALRRGG